MVSNETLESVSLMLLSHFDVLCDLSINTNT